MYDAKRGISAQQFHWLFVLIAGAIILLFFINVISAGKTSAENKLSISMMNSFDAIFAGSKASDNTVSIIPAPPKTSIEFVCDAEDGHSEIAISGTIASSQDPNRIMFAHGSITGRQYVVFTRSIDMPFKIDNALFVADLDTKYYILNNPSRTSLSNALVKLLPSNITSEKINDASALREEGYDEIVIISFGNLPQSLPALKEIRVKNVDITPSSTRGVGTVEFRSKKPGATRFKPAEGASKYYGSTMLLGAVFSENMDYYECTIKRIYKKLKVVSQLYTKRSVLLEAAVRSGVCKAAYHDAIGQLTELKAVASGNRSLTPNNINSQEVMKLRDIKLELESLNEQVELHSCPLIY